MELLTIMISSLNEGIIKCEKAVRVKNPFIRYLIIHQNHKNIEIPSFLDREDIEIVSSKTKGLAKSRNIGIRNCKTTYALIADDDVEYIEEGILKVLDIIQKQTLDFATFKIQTTDNSKEYKNYHTEESEILKYPFYHYFSSIEILVNIESLRKYNIRFDERFGLGTILSRAEEAVLIRDFCSANLKGKFFPVYIVKHPWDSSGKSRKSEAREAFIKGAMCQIEGRKKNFINRNKQSSLFSLMKINLFYNLGKIYIMLSNSFK